MPKTPRIGTMSISLPLKSSPSSRPFLKSSADVESLSFENVTSSTVVSSCVSFELPSRRSDRAFSKAWSAESVGALAASEYEGNAVKANIARMRRILYVSYDLFDVLEVEVFCFHTLDACMSPQVALAFKKSLPFAPWHQFLFKPLEHYE